MPENQPKITRTFEERSKKKIRRGFLDLVVGLKDFFRVLVNLQEGLDKRGTIKNIRENRQMRGANAWLLMCSIMVASLGLDLNSPAVIIGAMLISPLMSPILGIGMAVGINNRGMLSDSLKHFGISIGIALVTSFIFFKLTPFGEETPEISARTAPTLLDVLVAFFGGVAGIVSGSRKDKSNALPGVAIATALMPPLCVTGFGIANGDWEIALRSFYLFFLNATFVALATYLIVVFLKFPQKEFSDEKEKTRTQLFISVFSLLIIIPSIFILSGVLEKVRQKRKIEGFVKENFNDAIFRTSPIGDHDSLEIKLFLFEELGEDSIQLYQEKFKKLVNRCKLKIIQNKFKTDEFGREDFKNLESSIREEMLDMMEAEKTIQSEKDRHIEVLTSRLDSLQSDTVLFKAMTKEINALFSDLEEVGFAKIQQSNFDTTLLNLPVFTIKWNKKKSASSKRKDQKRLYDFIKLRARLDTLQLIPYR